MNLSDKISIAHSIYEHLTQLNRRKNPALSRGNGRKALYKGEKGHRHGMPEKWTMNEKKGTMNGKAGETRPLR